MNRKYLRLILRLTSASSAWHIQQSAALGLMPIVTKLISGEFNGSFQDEERAMKGISDEGQSLLNRYLSLSPEPFVSERETWLYDNFPVKMGEVLMIPVVGAITQEDYCGTAGTQTVMGWYQKAAADSSIKAIIEVKNTPGGEVFGTRALAETKLTVGKPIIGLTQGLECSAGLYIGATDSYKFANTNDCLIGSCGVMTTFQDWSKWYAKNDIVVTDLYSKDSPLKNDAYRRAMKGDFKGYTDGILFKLDQSFMSFMKQYRPGISQEALKGAEFLSTDAIDAGIIDQVGSFNDAYQFALEAIKSPNILQKSNSQMAKKQFFVSKLISDFKSMFGAEAEIVNDLGEGDDAGEGEGDDGAGEGEGDGTGEGEGEGAGADAGAGADSAAGADAGAGESGTGTPQGSTQESELSADARIQKLEADLKTMRALAAKGKATNVVKKTTDQTALQGKNVDAMLTNFED